jgi:predicted acyltransferase
MSAQLSEKGRVLSIDVYRGMTMMLMCLGGLGHALIEGLGRNHWITHQFLHVPWQGCVIWDLIQPSFMFIVGVAMPFAFAIRMSRGADHRTLIHHAAKRSLQLLIIGMAIVCIHKQTILVDVTTVLQQIAISYFFAYFLLGRSFKTQAGAALVVIIIHSALFMLWPGVGSGGAFAKNANFASWLDNTILGRMDPGGYTSFNAFSSIATVIFGMMAGELLRREMSENRKAVTLAIAGVAFLLIGSLLGPIVPIVKRIWTGSWVIYSTGWALLLLSLFYWLIEIVKLRRWTFPFMVVGMNSITIYIIYQMLRSSIDRWLWVFTRYFLEPLGGAGPVIQQFFVLGVLWYAVYWLYKRNIFLKVG